MLKLFFSTLFLVAIAIVCLGDEINDKAMKLQYTYFKLFYCYNGYTVQLDDDNNNGHLHSQQK